MVSTNSGSCGLPLVSDVIVLVVENELTVAVAASVLSTCSVVPPGLEKLSPAPPSARLSWLTTEAMPAEKSTPTT